MGYDPESDKMAKIDNFFSFSVKLELGKYGLDLVEEQKKSLCVEHEAETLRKSE
jgi:hypothetical protein